MIVNPSKVFRDGGKFLSPTGESPQQFQDLLFVVYEGKSPESVVESLRTIESLRGLIEVDPATMSVQWRVALGLPKSTVSKAESKPKPIIRKRVASNPPTLNSRRTSRKTNVAEIHYITVSPGLGWLYLNFFMGLSILSVLILGVKPWLMSFLVAMGLFSVLYAWASSFLGGKTARHTGGA
jgi:hypothetical protein